MKRIFLHESTPNKRTIAEVAELINNGAIVIFPTDTIYALGCLMTNRPGIERICKVLDKKEKAAKMSLICPNISVVSQYTPQIDNHVFREMKRCLPGPFTFILKSNNMVQKFFKNNKEEIGVRIPAHHVLDALNEFLHAPLISTSLNVEFPQQKVYFDPDDIAEDFEHSVDLLLDCGKGEFVESTVLDCTSGTIELVRQGKGEIDL
jgi:tRNA threonylcarbamoyl adenosine modification protein (Sua5/YciO/YrdC/YwlC family)